ncbi:antirestriction protein [Paraburkholderia nemoris]|uniref:antirestriction protein n=1 Tax=Paraburkholderia nemoris TaxID=2793076 RepID=UPI001F201759|nr:antirestriction protein [Paraburkholderia nemoris]
MVPAERRTEFFPRYLGGHFLKGESMIYDWARRLSAEYTGGSWEFFELSNSGFYVAPSRSNALMVEWNLNSFSDTMQPDAFGIVVTLFTLCHLSEITMDDSIIERFYALREFALNHVDAGKIFRAVD